jgi:arabinose-5-phosphate isomerase
MGRQIVRDEASALSDVAKLLDDNFVDVVRRIALCQGHVVVLGMGKAGLVGQKIAATLCSTGSRSHFLHPAEALHGDLGRVARGDIALVFSHSGTTEEIVCLVPLLKRLGVSVVAITANLDSPLGRSADTVLTLGQLREAGPLGLAPSTSTTAMMALGDALALVASHVRGFDAADFAHFHPGGNLGRLLTRVEDAMRPLHRCRVGNESQTVRQVLVQVGRPGRRTGAIMLTNDEGVLTGLFTDSDLARLFEHRRDRDIDKTIGSVMTRSPTTIALDALLSEAVQVFAQRRISELPVVASDGCPRGLVDITDVVGMLPTDFVADGAKAETRVPVINEAPDILPLTRQT